MSQAVNRAADAGIIPVVAAGNSGPARYTIGAPGAATKAITVAAMADPAENGFGLAGFSSRGPTRDERVKPEISAPGVNIMAPKANSTNQYVSYSGTSMATPNDGQTPGGAGQASQGKTKPAGDRPRRASRCIRNYTYPVQVGSADLTQGATSEETAIFAPEEVAR